MEKTKERKLTTVRTKNGIEEIYLTRSRAIRLRCLDCCGFDKRQVKECSNTECCLFEMKLNGKLEGEKAGIRRNKTIREFCKICMCGDKKLVLECTDTNCSFFTLRPKKRIRKNERQSTRDNGVSDSD